MRNSSDLPELLRIQHIEIRLRRRAGCLRPPCFRTVCAVNAHTCLSCYIYAALLYNFLYRAFNCTMFFVKSKSLLYKNKQESAS